MASKLQECVSRKMSVLHDEGSGLTQEQMLGKAYGICRDKLGIGKKDFEVLEKLIEDYKVSEHTRISKAGKPFQVKKHERKDKIKFKKVLYQDNKKKIKNLESTLKTLKKRMDAGDQQATKDYYTLLKYKNRLAEENFRLKGEILFPKKDFELLQKIITDLKIEGYDKTLDYDKKKEVLEKVAKVKLHARTYKTGKVSIVREHERRTTPKKTINKEDVIEMFNLFHDVIQDVGMGAGESEAWSKAFTDGFDEIMERFDFMELLDLILDLTEDQISTKMGGGQLSPEVMSIIQELSLKARAPTLMGPDGARIKGVMEVGNIPLIAIQSSNVKGGGVFNNELVIQFHQTAKQGGQRSYRYKLPTPEDAREVFLELVNATSAGRWVWENIRGTAKGPAYFPPHKTTMGGTSASLIPYTVSGRSPVETRQGYKKYDELSKELRKYKMEVKEPPVSAEAFTIPEIRKFERKETLKELRKLISQVMVKRP